MDRGQEFHFRIPLFGAAHRPFGSKQDEGPSLNVEQAGTQPGAVKPVQVHVTLNPAGVLVWERFELNRRTVFRLEPLLGNVELQHSHCAQQGVPLQPLAVVEQLHGSFVR